MKMKSVIIGVMGGGSAGAEDLENARKLGRGIAKQGWILLNGGRNSGIMDASAQGAFEEGGMTVGILPDDHADRVSDYIHIPVLTGMGSARNAINVLSAHIIVACPGGCGTVSEIALALKSRRPVILFRFDAGNIFDSYAQQGLLFREESVDAVLKRIRKTVLQNGE
ncbi:MAG: TIGR00725 family protein [Desulfococcaceae bacterium]|nr:TIGR00725 family protein [Desulfococcaceae bacterium]